MPEFYHADQLPLFPSTKICTACHIEKQLEKFYKDKSRKDGYTIRCKECDYLAAHAKRVSKNPEAKIGDRHKRPLVQSEEEKRQRRIERCRAYRLENLEKDHARKRDYYAANKEKIREEQNVKNRTLAAEKRAAQPVVVIPEGYKKCAECKEEKLFEEFYNSGQSKDGYSYYCKGCCDKKRGRKQIGKIRNRRNRPITPWHKWCHGCKQEKPVERFWPDKTKRDGLNARCIDCRIDYGHVHWETNKEELKRRQREWYSRPENRLKVLALNRKRSGHVTTPDTVDYGFILERDGGWCYICEQPILPDQEVEFDHVIPLQPPKKSGREPGPHHEDNVKVTHGVCNRRKHNKLLEEMTPFQRRGPTA